MPTAIMAASPSAPSKPQPNNPFIQNLASSSKATRDHALLALRTFLSRPEASFSALDNRKLWKGLFYCMWMSDKPLNQQRLARDLASLVDDVRTVDGKLAFVTAFWETMSTMWQEIDALRMDKFLYLVRCYVNKGFELCARKDWADDSFVERYLGVLETVPLEPRDHRIPNGIRFHVIDVYVDELEKVDTQRTVDLGKVLEPLRKLKENTLTKAIRERCAEALGNERVLDWKGEQKQENGIGDGDAEFGGFED